MRASVIDNFVKPAGKETETFKRYLEAKIKVLNAGSKQVAFLITINGRYKWGSQVSRFAFSRDYDLQAYNKYADEMASAVAELQRTKAEIDALGPTEINNMVQQSRLFVFASAPRRALSLLSASNGSSFIGAQRGRHITARTLPRKKT